MVLDGLFGWEIRGRRKRIVELASMLKEKEKGDKIQLYQILAKFAAKTGVKINTASEYLDILIESGLIVVKSGEETWTYDSSLEYEIFGTEL